MVFSSMIFLCVFFPVVFLLYQCSRSLVFKNALLIVSSLVFYTYGEPVYILLMLASILANYLFGRLLGRYPKARWVVVLAVLFNIGLLFWFKYLDFFGGWFNALSGLNVNFPVISLPVGISFFTFQALSYVIDVYRQQVEPARRLWVMVLYISFFPQLIAGPIVKYHDIDQQIHERTITLEKQTQGLIRFIFGLSKKVLIANTLAVFVDTFYALPMNLVSTPAAWLAAICYMLQIYFDFSGYSDMAIGMSKMFGFDLKENFNYPYISASIKEFWRRWHISLSSWFRDYLYIPLGGNRKGKFRTDLNKWIVFTATGLWHGANLTFLLWGWWHGSFLLIESHTPYERIPAFFRHIFTLLIVLVGFVLFRSDNLSQALAMLSRMFVSWNFSRAALALFTSQLSLQLIITVLAGVLLSIPWTALKNSLANVYLGCSVSMVLLVLCLLSLASGTYNPFIYFRF